MTKFKLSAIAALITIFSFNISAADNKAANLKPQKATNIVQTDVKQATNNVAQKTIILKIAHVVKAGSPKDKGAIRLKESLEAKFPGKVKVQVYPDNTLYKDRDELEALELGVVDIIIPNFGKAANAYSVPEFQLFDLPFLFADHNEAAKYIKSLAAQKLLDVFNKKTKIAEAIGIWPVDFRNFHGPVPFKTKEDFTKHSFRIESAGLIKQATELFGVKDTTVLTFNQIYGALKKNGEYKLDAAETAFTNFWGAKLYEVSPWITLSQHNFQAYAVLINKRIYNHLPDDIRKGLYDSVQEAADHHMQVALEERSKLEQEILKKGIKMHVWTPEEKANFKAAIIPVHEEYKNKISKDVLMDAYTAIKGTDFASTQEKLMEQARKDKENNESAKAASPSASATSATPTVNKPIAPTTPPVATAPIIKPVTPASPAPTTKTVTK